MFCKLSGNTGYQFALIAAGMTGFYPLYDARADMVPMVMLANNYQQGLSLEHYWMSEKLDGIRAYWTGEYLLTRKGKKIYAPEWFIRNLPAFPVEGELWAGRGAFNQVQKTVFDHKPDTDGWKEIRFMAFDLPDEEGFYLTRYKKLKRVVEGIGSVYLKCVEQQAITDEVTLLASLDLLIDRGGEGIMLRRFDRPYRTGRSNDLVKLKKYQDADAQVIGYKPGNGKFSGMLGSVLVVTDDGHRFYIGSGLTDDLRHTPPPLGSIITYRFNGYTGNGLPRFARFLRVRRD